MINFKESILVNGKLYWLVFCIAGLIGIAYSMSVGNFMMFAAVVSMPLALITLIGILDKPSILLYVIFTVNYFIMGITRYIAIEGVSVLIDVMFVSLLLIMYVHAALKQNIRWRDALNLMTFFSVVWLAYCLLELVNPTGMVELWFRSRGIMYYGLICSVCVSVLIQEYKQVKLIVNLYAVFSFLAVLKALMQKFVGFDDFEMAWLIESEAIKTHVLITGVIRYFSFFTDGGNFGSNMGASAIIFLIMTFFVKRRGLKIFYGIVGVTSLYAMFMSGTRGAMIVPLGGLALFVVISKNYKAMLAGGMMLVLLYVFFAFTNIGEGNMMIRRMRTAFRPSEDASFNVRKINQARLGEYLKDKPFGEGLGLSGSEGLKYTVRLTTQIPNDSWYVKIWVETGIVGLTIYLLGYIMVLVKCMHTLMFKVHERELYGVVASLLCGVFGLLLSAYGNPFFGQFPTAILAYTFLSIALKAEKYEPSYIDANKRLMNEKSI